jgi:hypothetical protein
MVQGQLLVVSGLLIIVNQIPPSQQLRCSKRATRLSQISSKYAPTRLPSPIKISLGCS